MSQQPICIDCLGEGVTKYRPTPHGGPRSPLCVTHWRARKRMRRSRTQELHVERTYQLSTADYYAILAEQGGGCPCGRGKGVGRKRLSVDHDHHFHDGEDPPPHPPEMGCRDCVRGLLCDTCNRIVIGRYDIESLYRVIAYIVDPPARRVLR